MKTHRRWDSGGSGIWLMVIFIGLLGVIGYNIGRLYFDKSTIENEVSLMLDEELIQKRGGVREKVARVLNQYEAIYDPENILVDMHSDGTRMSLSARFERPANLLVTQLPMQFQIYVQRERSKVGGVVQSVQESVEDSYNNSAQKYQKALKNAQPGGSNVDVNQ